MVSLLNKKTKTVLEPTPGIGNIVEALKGYDVTAPANYWDLDKNLRFDAVVANLPFSSKTFFGCPAQYEGKGMAVTYAQMKVLMNMSDQVILLLPWFTILDSDVRMRLLYKYGLVSITALPRWTFKYARIQTCIYQLRKGYEGPTEFKVFELLEKDAQIKMFK